MKRVLLTLILIALSFSLCSCGEEEGSELWSYTIGSLIPPSPSIEENKIVVNSLDGKILCFDLNGKILWQYEIEEEIFSSPLIAGDKVYISSAGGKIYCLSLNNGNKLWEYKASFPIVSSPAFYADGIFFTGTDGSMYAISTNGSLIWSKKVEGSIYATPAVEDGKVIIGSLTGKVHCIDAYTGNIIWDLDLNDPIESNICIDDTGQIYVATASGKLYCLDIDDGTELWQISFSSKIVGSPAYYDEKVFLSLFDGSVYALTSKGRILWTYKADGALTTSICPTDNYLYFGDSKNNLYCLDASNGEKKWTFTLDSPASSAPIAKKDKVVIGTQKGKLYCLKAEGSDAKWPTFQGNTARTGKESK